MKHYIKPELEIVETAATKILALSMINSKADNSEVLSKEETAESWNIWEE